MTSEVPYLTPEQRMEIYEQERRRVRQAAPLIGRRAKCVLAIYGIGGILLYFGIAHACLGFWGHWKWELKPEHDLPAVLGNSAIELVRPFLAVFFTVWPVGLIGVLGLGLFGWGSDLLRDLRSWLSR